MKKSAANPSNLLDVSSLIRRRRFSKFSHNFSIFRYVTALRNDLRDKQASALLVAILVMAVLLVAGLGINRLIITELRVEKTLVDGGKAYYAAEGASELALYDIAENVSGYEVEDETGEITSEAEYLYSILARGEMWPCDEYGDLTEVDEMGNVWRVLEPEESVMIPLFYDDGEVSDFDLYFDYDTETYVAPSGEALRWKILGITESGFTEAISSYDEVTGESFWDAGMKEAGSYQGQGFSWGGRLYEWEAGENVQNFLENHMYNYLILTNVIQGAADGDMLMVRLDDGNDEFVCEYVKVEADGEEGGYVQQIDVYMKEGEPLPVFDFVLWEKE